MLQRKINQDNEDREGLGDHMCDHYMGWLGKVLLINSDLSRDLILVFYSSVTNTAPNYYFIAL